MAIALDPTYYNRTAVGTTTDKVGKCLIDLKNALQAAFVASGSLTGWRRTGQGDGRSAHSTVLDADIFTGNGGKGYNDVGATWNTSSANTITNPRAWIQWTLYVDGVATSRMFQIQRSISASSGEEYVMLAGIAELGLTGVSSSTVCPATGTVQYWGGGLNVFNSFAAWSWASTVSPAPSLGSTATWAWQVWTDDGTLGGFLGDFFCCFYNSDIGDRAVGFGYLSLTDTSVGDTAPYLQVGGTWSQTLGGDAAYDTANPFVVNSGAAGNWAIGPAGASFVARPVLYADSEGNVRPPGLAAQASADSAGNYRLVPYLCQLDGAPAAPRSMFKGRVRGARLVWAGLAAHVYPHVATDTTGKVWVILGSVALPWRAALSPTWASSSASSLWQDTLSEAPDPEPEPEAPEVTWLDEPGSNQSRYASLDFVCPDFTEITVAVILADAREVESVWAAGDFTYRYRRSSLTEEGSFSLNRTGGWPSGAFEIAIYWRGARIA